jgi:RHH-type proline utilization regulon transcriptional repressor/proline dehydrogenase/delta 1-pyrroline-5-carboxylate dehydrogenase
VVSGTEDGLIDRSVALATDLLVAARAGTTSGDLRRQLRLRRLLASESGTRLVFSLADRVLRPTSARAAAGQLVAVTSGDLSGMSVADRSLLRLAALASRVAPAPVVGLVAARLRRETGALVYPAEPAPLGRRLRRLWAAERRPNLNLLGEAILGWQEAERRTAAVDELLQRRDVDCVSVKVSSVAAGLSLIDFEGSVARITGPLQHLYRRAAAGPQSKLVNLDMEEHRDLDLTVEAFIRSLDGDEFASLTAGIALQAYLPDSHAALDRLLDFARRRREAGRAPIRIRLVKGANLAMENVNAELHDWPPAPYGSKADTDASYVALMERLVEAAGGGAVLVGVASHNLFDVALALILSEAAGAPVDIEMLAGMADHQATAVAGRAGRLLFYVPATTRVDFRNALAYLARRLDENTTPDGFLRHALDMVPGSAAWQDQAGRFALSVRARHQVRREPFQTQDRLVAPVTPSPRDPGGTAAEEGRFSNEPDTDLTVASNRLWAVAALRTDPRSAPPVASESDVDTAVARAVDAGPAWAATPPAARRRYLEAAADALAAGRAAAVAVMAAEAGKTFAEADPEVSEAVDYARWYAAGTDLLASLDHDVDSVPCGTVVVSPPWNFPYAIAAGGVLAALAAGNTVILKPSPEARATAALLVEQLHSAGLDDGRVQVVATPDGPAGRHLITHDAVGAVILTGSFDTAMMFGSWTPGRRLLAETSGKNAMVVTATADVDQAVGDLVRSAFGHAGQKCSAASLAIVDRSIYDHSPFLRQLADATRALRVGPADDPASEVGPIVGPFTDALERALTVLDPGESWLVTPRRFDGDRHLWSPGVRLGVRPGSWAHRTEWFGPVLGVMRADHLDQALEWQNAVPYGLTAGLHSLDPTEHRRWVDAVAAGNLYVNRPTTGAIVGRQPFGGWKRSSVGPTAKTGGPNYLLALRRWHDRAETTVDDATTDYRRWWDRHFGRVTELAGLTGESNQFRYRPFDPGVVVRLAGDGSDDEVAKALAAATVTGTPVRVSSARRLAPWPREWATKAAPPAVESAASFAASLGNGPPQSDGVRLRLLGSAEPEVLAAAAGRGITALDEPICSHGRVELVRWLREQVVTRSLHRYGNVVYAPLSSELLSVLLQDGHVGIARSCTENPVLVPARSPQEALHLPAGDEEP